MVAIKIKESVTLVQMVWINKQEANLETRPETYLTSYKWLEVSFLVSSVAF